MPGDNALASGAASAVWDVRTAIEEPRRLSVGRRHGRRRSGLEEEAIRSKMATRGSVGGILRPQRREFGLIVQTPARCADLPFPGVPRLRGRDLRAVEEGPRGVRVAVFPEQSAQPQDGVEQRHNDGSCEREEHPIEQPASEHCDQLRESHREASLPPRGSDAIRGVCPFAQRTRRRSHTVRL